MRTVILAPDGSLHLKGQDLGPFVQQFFGYSEYEFVRTVSPAGVEQRRREMDIGPDDDLISALVTRFQGPGGSNLLEKFLAAKGIESEFWNRIGD